ncbi:MAG TPA: hypothetical protein VE959_39050 [Bryobacteraceae bacterium]|nr:hypothetical protein [Bryobacteraceae bacterium]
MAKPKVRMPVQTLRVDERPGAAASSLDASPAASEVLARTAAAPWWIAFSFLAVLGLVMVWLPISRISAHYEINYNEGWNAYQQQVVADGGRVYGQAPVYEYANYPPVSFHVVGWLARLTHDVNGTGRWVSLLAFLALVALTGLAVERLTGSLRCAVFSALWVVVLIGALKSERIGMNDPHLLGMAFVAFGVYAYVRAPESPLWLRISAVAFVAGIFTKQSLLAFPLAVSIQLLLASRKHLVTWIVAGAAAAAVLLGLTFALDGPHLLEHLALPRVYSYAFFLSNIVWYLLMFQAAIVACLVWCFRYKPGSAAGLLVWGFAAANALAFWFSAGAGTDLNHFFDSAVVMSMIGGVALPYAVWASEKVRFRSALLTILLTVPFSIGVLTMLAPRVQEDLGTSRSIPRLEQEFAAAVQFVKSQPGPALCEHLLVCFEAGKPEDYDPFQMDQLVKTGKLAETSILKMLDDRHFSTIQLLMDENHPLAPVERPGFSQAFMTKLLSDYKLAMRTSTYAILVPNR